MAKKKKRKKFSAVQTVKELARERRRAPAGQVVPDQKKKQSSVKHKPTLGQMQEGE